MADCSYEVMHACELKSRPGTSKCYHYLLVDFFVFLNMFCETSYPFYICYFSYFHTMLLQNDCWMDYV